MVYGYIYRIAVPECAEYPNGAFYIGQRKGKKEDLRYFGSGVKIIDWISRHGTKQLKRTILAWANSLAECNDLEHQFISEHWGDPRLLNLTTGGGSCEVSDEVREKLRIANTGSKIASDTLKRLHQDPEYRKRFDRTGCKHSKEVLEHKSRAFSGLQFFNNGVINVRARDCPSGFVAGRLSSVKFKESHSSEEFRLKVSEHRKCKQV
jgi:hypothetical protein